MPVGTRVYRCVQKVKTKGGHVNPYAVCQAATHQSYATGKALPPETSHARHAQKKRGNVRYV